MSDPASCWWKTWGGENSRVGENLGNSSIWNKILMYQIKSKWNLLNLNYMRA